MQSNVYDFSNETTGINKHQFDRVNTMPFLVRFPKKACLSGWQLAYSFTFGPVFHIRACSCWEIKAFFHIRAPLALLLGI